VLAFVTVLCSLACIVDHLQAKQMCPVCLVEVVQHTPAPESSASEAARLPTTLPTGAADAVHRSSQLDDIVNECWQALPAGDSRLQHRQQRIASHADILARHKFDKLSCIAVNLEPLEPTVSTVRQFTVFDEPDVSMQPLLALCIEIAICAIN
jgi:hypothetical protein